MASLSYERSKTIPLRNGRQIVDRVSDLVGAASSARLWVLLLNSERAQMRHMFMVDTQGVSGEQIAPGAAGLVAGASSIEGAQSAIFVLERVGGEKFTAVDRSWAKSISAACRLESIFLAGLVISHSQGVRWLAEDDFVA